MYLALSVPWRISSYVDSHVIFSSAFKSYSYFTSKKVRHTMVMYLSLGRGASVAVICHVCSNVQSLLAESKAYNSWVFCSRARVHGMSIWLAWLGSHSFAWTRVTGGPVVGLIRLSWPLIYKGSISTFLTLQWCESHMHSAETVLWIWIFFWAVSVLFDSPLCCWAVATSHAFRPSDPGKNILKFTALPNWDA